MRKISTAASAYALPDPVRHGQGFDAAQSAGLFIGVRAFDDPQIVVVPYAGPPAGVAPVGGGPWCYTLVAMEPSADRRSEPLAATDRAAIERRLRRFFAADPRGAAAVYLFGSVARGTARRDSDVDVAVLLQEDPPRTLAGMRFDLQSDLEELLGLPVQLVVLNHRSADLIHHVLSDGRLLLDHDPERRILFEVRARNEYFDLLPFLRRYRRLEPVR